MLRQMNNLTYITYQTFPAFTANSIQTMSNIKYLVKQDFNVTLFFPLREKTSTDNSKKLKEFYSIREDFKIIGSKHSLPFGKIDVFNRVLFLFSHLIWSYTNVNKLSREKPSSELFFTRSDWVFFFLSRKNRKVVFECHQYTKIRKYLINKALKKETSKIIFLNKNLKDDYEKKYNLKNNYIILHNGVDIENYSSNNNKNDHEIIFVGKLKRFGETRNIDFLLQAMKSLDEKYSLKIVGAEKSEITELEKQSRKLGIEKRIKIYSRVDYSKVAECLLSSSFGILINSSSNTHSTSYTSPLKYFEYLAAGLKIIAVDFPSHRNLPFSENIEYYKEGNLESFVSAIERARYIKNPDIDLLKKISLETRAKKISEFIN